jgi:hypothetical protein
MKKSSNNQKNMASNQKFGWLFAAIFAVSFGYFQWNQSLGLAIISAFLATLFVLATIFAPTALAPLNKAWYALSIFLGRVVSPLVLSAIFFILIAPVAVITRLFGRDALFLKRRQVSTYWVDKELIEPESFKNQF